MALNPTLQTTAGRPMTTYLLQDWMQMDVYKDTIMSSISYAILGHKSMYCPTITQFLDSEFNFILPCNSEKRGYTSRSLMACWRLCTALKWLCLIRPMHSNPAAVYIMPQIRSHQLATSCRTLSAWVSPLACASTFVNTATLLRKQSHTPCYFIRHLTRLLQRMLSKSHSTHFAVEFASI
jgi:hypothetical protein